MKRGDRSAAVDASGFQDWKNIGSTPIDPPIDTPGGSSAEVDAPTCNIGEHRFESGLPPDAIAHAIAVLEALQRADPKDPAYVAVERAAAHLYKASKKKRRLARKQDSRRRDREATLGSERAAAYFATEPNAEPRSLRRARPCYVCKQPFRQLHAFYHMLCPACAERSAAARSDTADLRGRRALVTGGRIKVGFEVARALLRAGAHVAITTRFPRDAARRFADCPGRERLEIHGLDFVDMRTTLAWIDAELRRGEPLDILVNNAAQTLHRPPESYAALIAGEQDALPAGNGLVDAIAGEPRDAAAAIAAALALPVDADGIVLDARPINSWVTEAADVEPRELVEVHLINAMAPFLLATRLKPLFLASRFPDRYIINVSSMEGVFTYGGKQVHHPHTNMAKAALNMFTRTSAADYVRDGIYMTSVDPGWISQENPLPTVARVEADGFCPPLDAVDAAARVLAPILRGVRGNPVAGVLFKDFEPASW